MLILHRAISINTSKPAKGDSGDPMNARAPLLRNA